MTVVYWGLSANAAGISSSENIMLPLVFYLIRDNIEAVDLHLLYMDNNWVLTCDLNVVNQE